jgi:acyl dehydratase
MSLQDTLTARIGQTATSDWFTVTQDVVNQFADVTLDHQFIHVDPERAAKETPFGGPIAHGFLILSMLSHLAEKGGMPAIEGVVMSINYGFDKVRFLTPVPVGAKIRGKFTFEGFKERSPGQYQLTNNVEVEIEGVEKPALVAQWLSVVIGG